MLHLSRLIIDHFYTVCDLSCKFNEILVRWVFVHVVVSVFFILKLDHEAMGVGCLREALVTTSAGRMRDQQRAPQDYYSFHQKMI